MPQFRENIKKMRPYKPPLEGRASKGYLLLDFNEMTISPGPKVRRAIKDFVDSGGLQKYPEYGDIEAKIAEYAGVEAGQAMLVNGSDQGIDVVMRAFLEKGDKVIIPSPSFAMFEQSAQLQGAEILQPLYAQNNLSFPLEEVLNLIDEQVRLIVVCNPNNPTGTAVLLEDLLKVLKKAKDNGTAVLHDEAYFEFSGITAKDLISRFDNLFVSRTFSKTFGLASLRLGCILSQKENIQELLKIRGPYDVNMTAKAGLSAALSDTSYVSDYAAEVMQASKPKLEQFFRENNINFWPGAANFLLLKPESPEKILKGLEAEGILVRPRTGPNIEGTIRVSVGAIKDTEKFIRAYSKLLK